MFDQKCQAYLCLVHGKKILVKPGDEPKLGELLMIADNTGFSTGPHTHFGMYRVKLEKGAWIFVDKNNANGSFDPTLFSTGAYAIDKATVGTLIQSGLRYLSYLMSF